MGVICYNCNQHGHISRNCPKKKEQPLKIEEGKGTRQARVYNLTKEDIEANPSVIQGTLFILDTLVHALIDPGSTHSFISHALAGNLRVETESMGCLMVISTPMGRSM